MVYPKESELDALYDVFMHDLAHVAHDGVLEVDLELLHSLDLLEWEASPIHKKGLYFKDSFYLLESEDKLTLFNERYLIWITPGMLGDKAGSLTLLCLRDQSPPRVEVAFATRGVYNSPALVLQLIDRFIRDIEENDCTFSHLNDSSLGPNT